MYLNVMELIKDAKVGTLLKTKGGQGHTWTKFVFIKMAKNKVDVYSANTWRTISSPTSEEHAQEKLCTLTPDMIKFKLPKGDKDWQENYPKQNPYRVWDISSFFSLGLLFGCRTKWSKGEHIIACNMNGEPAEVMPHGTMNFDWSGNLVSTVPLWAEKRYNEWNRKNRDDRNRQSRARYAQAKVEREFKKFEKDGKLDEFPLDKLFQIKNAQFRTYAINTIGLEKALEPYEMVVIDKATVDNRPYELVEIELPGMETYDYGSTRNSAPKKCLYLKMTNPSTGEYHLEGVPRKTDNTWDYIPEETVRGALSWRDGESAKETRWGGSEQTSEWKYVQPTTIT
jgi:hypothetical protein